MTTGFPELEDLYGLGDAPGAAVRAPLWPVYGACGAVLLSALGLVWAVQHQVVWGVLGYVLAGLVTPLLTVSYRLLRRRARKNPSYLPRPGWERVLVWATVTGIVLGVAHAWFVATELAKQ